MKSLQNIPTKVFTDSKLFVYTLDGTTSMVLSSNSKQLISGSFDKSIKILDLDTDHVHQFENIHQGKLS